MVNVIFKVLYPWPLTLATFYVRNVLFI